MNFWGWSRHWLSKKIGFVRIFRLGELCDLTAIRERVREIGMDENNRYARGRYTTRTSDVQEIPAFPAPVTLTLVPDCWREHAIPGNYRLQC